MVGRYGALLSHLELAEYNADVNVGEVKDKSHSNVRGLINHLTSAIPAGKVPGGSQAFQATQDAALNKWLSLDNRAEAVSDRDNAVETIANGLIYPTEDGKHSPVDTIRDEAMRQRNNTSHSQESNLWTLKELHKSVPDKENFIDDQGNVKTNVDANQEEAYQFAKRSYWTDLGRENVPPTTDATDIIEKAYRGSFRDSK